MLVVPIKREIGSGIELDVVVDEDFRLGLKRADVALTALSFRYFVWPMTVGYR